MSAADLNASTVTITAPTGFEIRKTLEPNAAFGSSITLSIDGDGTLVTTSVDIRVAASASATMTGDIALSAGTETVTLNVTATASSTTIMGIQGNNISIARGDASPDASDHTQFGTVTVNKPTTKTYTIQNTSSTDNLVVSDINLSGPDAAAFAVGGITLPATIPPGSFTTFTVTVTAPSAGLKAAAITIVSDDDCSN